MGISTATGKGFALVTLSRTSLGAAVFWLILTCVLVPAARRKRRIVQIVQPLGCFAQCLNIGGLGFELRKVLSTGYQ